MPPQPVQNAVLVLLVLKPNPLFAKLVPLVPSLLPVAPLAVQPVPLERSLKPLALRFVWLVRQVPFKSHQDRLSAYLAKASCFHSKEKTARALGADALRK